MHLDPGQRRAFGALAILTAVSTGTAWSHGWEQVVGMLIVGVVVGAFFLALFHYVNRFDRRARRLRSGQ